MTTKNTKQRDRTFDKFFRKVNWREFHVNMIGNIRHMSTNACPLAHALGQRDIYNVVTPAHNYGIVPNHDAGQQVVAAADNMWDNRYFLPHLRKRMIKNIERSRKHV